MVSDGVEVGMHLAEAEGAEHGRALAHQSLRVANARIR